MENIKIQAEQQGEVQRVVVSWEVPCKCECHNDRSIMHMIACCNKDRIIKYSASFLATELITLAESINKIKFGFIKNSH